MRTISLEECSQVAGGDGGSCPTNRVEIIQSNGPDGSFGGFVMEILGSIAGALGGGGPTSIPANNGELGFRG
jgi:hypothetical protein